MIDWIKQNIDPPGLEKPNRFAIFSTIGKIMGRVSDDAKKAFHAHFPYLADERKLEQHGQALGIPRLMHDAPGEYRNRVTGASFFLMRAGERGFIMDLLRERFDDRFRIIEKFLQLQVKVAELTTVEREWILELLDRLIDPNVSLELSQWLRFVEHMFAKDCPAITMIRTHFYNGKYEYDGSIFYDGETVSQVELI